MSVLRPTDVPVRDPVAQVVALPGDRLLIRHRAGMSLLGGVGRQEVIALLDRVDGRRTAAEVAPDARSAAILRGLVGEAVHVRGAGPVPSGEPAAGRETPEALLPLPEPFPTPGAGRRVVFLEETPYRRILEVLAGLRDRPTLFVAPDPDGVRIGRTCLGCALLAALAPAGLPARESLAVAARLRTVRIADLAPTDPVRRKAFLRRVREVVAREAAVDRDGEGVVLVAPDGTERLLPTPRRDDCPVCGGAARDAGSSGATVKEPPLHPLQVGIVGGGTAGFLAALALRAKRPEVRVTLIRSPDIPVIGVGEATTPLMPQFLHADLGIGAAELFREVRPTFKLGIRFDWGHLRSSRGAGGGFPYPFGPLRTLEAATWDGELDSCSPWAVLMAAGVLPVTAGEDGRLAAGFGTEVAYHLDNRRLAAYLERLARLRGVEVVDARIVGVERTAVGDLPEVVSLVGERGRRFIFDLYVDCSGFRSLLVGDALGSPFVDYGESLFTDRAVVGTVARAPGRGPGAPMPPFTRATARAAGWSWSIPQPEADHVGSVYSSAFAGADDVARELEAALGAPVEGLRELRFRSGRREHFWRGNVVALGNAYGFVEPLESTSLHLLIRQIGLLVRHLPAGDEVRDRLDRWNGEVGAFWDYVAWFLAIHFRFNRRLDTPFWRACREEADVSAHGELIERFREAGPLAYRDDRAFDYPDPLWGPEGVDTLLLGQGVPCRMPEPPGSEAAWRAEVEEWRRRAGRCLSQDETLARLTESPEVLEQLEATFRNRGPAF